MHVVTVQDGRRVPFRVGRRCGGFLLNPTKIGLNRRFSTSRFVAPSHMPKVKRTPRPKTVPTTASRPRKFARTQIKTTNAKNIFVASLLSFVLSFPPLEEYS